MGGASILALVFVILPGFLGDAVRRTLFDDRRMTDFERTVRSVGISACGLCLYMFVAWLVDVIGRAAVGIGLVDWARTPTYLSAIADAKGVQPVVIDSHAALAFLLHIVAAIVVAIGWGYGANHKGLREALSKRTRRTNTEPWRALWNDCHPPASYPAPDPNAPARLARYVEIRTTGGERYKGLLISAGDTSSAHDVVIGDPLLWIESAWDWYSKGWKYLFVAGARIETIAFTNVETELVRIGLLRDLITETITEESNARRESEPEAQPGRAGDEAVTEQTKS